MENRPQGREKRNTGSGKGFTNRGSVQGSGPVGNPGGYDRGSGSGGGKRSGGGGGLMKIIILLFALLGGGAGATGLFGGGLEALPVPAAPTYTQTAPAPTTPPATPPATPPTSPAPTQTTMAPAPFFDYSSLFGGGSAAAPSSGSSGWMKAANTGRLNTAVDPAARAKRTQILGRNQDVVTVMVYMCGTDLESKSAMGTKDLQEMINARIGSNVNLLVFTGGCARWQNNVISSNVNQIYKIQDGKMQRLVDNAGTGAMTSPKTLTSFIQFCTKNFPANRNMLILWDHGSGSISGYGYDEKNRSAGSMTLKGLDEALTAGKTKFDFIGFDACLMATLENGLTMARHADYLIASEETEPGLGWYYTNWLTALSQNTSMSTLEIGKRIADDFVTACGQSCPGQKTTLSVVDLAELEATIPQSLKDFSASTLAMLKNNGYAEVAKARSSVREFSVSTKTDLIDAVHLAMKLDTDEGRDLADNILSAVKYNRTSSNMTNAYGLSLYFPYQKTSKVSTAVSAYRAIGMDDTYTECIRAFASMEVGGQAAAGGTTSPATVLGGGSYGGSMIDGDLLGQMLAQLLGGSGGAYGITAPTDFFDRSMDVDAAAEYLAQNRFDPDALLWMPDGGSYSLRLGEDQWSMVRDLELNVFADDGSGYIDLGLDTTFDFTANGDLVGQYDGTWLAIDNQNVAYYHTETTVDGSSYSITGRVPILLNGDRAELILVFTDEDPYGSIAGARRIYEDETDTVAKGITELNEGDTIDFLFDYYGYDGSYMESRILGEQHIYTGSEIIGNASIGLDAVASYRFTDIYNNSFWTPAIPNE